VQQEQEVRKLMNSAEEDVRKEAQAHTRHTVLEFASHSVFYFYE